ncbi:MAG: hypothetical protein ACXWT1_17395 [Methylobacter sp.]
MNDRFLERAGGLAIVAVLVIVNFMSNASINENGPKILNKY